MSEITELLERSLFGVFGERDPQARAAVIAEVFSDDIRFADTEGVAVGHDEVNAKAGAILDAAPGFVFQIAGPVYEVQDLGSASWDFGPEGAEPVVSGVDIALVKDGKITSLHTYLTRS